MIPVDFRGCTVILRSCIPYNVGKTPVAIAGLHPVALPLFFFFFNRCKYQATRLNVGR